MENYDEKVKAILAPFANLNDKRNQNYDTVMRGVIACHPELRNNRELYDAVADEVQRRFQISVSKAHSDTLLSVGNR